MPIKSRLAVIINLTARQAKALSPTYLQDHLQTLFTTHALNAELYLVSSNELPEVLSKIRDQKFDTVIAGGGDGTLRAVASYLAGTSMALGILPLGTFNNFARTLGVPLALDKAVTVIAKGIRASVDVAEVNGYLFINNASVGFYARAVRLREAVQRRLRFPKLPAMAYALLAVFWRLPKLNLRLSYLPGDSEMIRVPFVFVGNNPYTSKPLFLIRKRGIAQGCLSVLFTHRIDRKGLVIMAAKTLLWPIQQDPALEERQVQELIIESFRQRLHLALDGEIIALRPPLIFRIRPQVLQVICPESPLEE